MNGSVDGHVYFDGKKGRSILIPISQVKLHKDDVKRKKSEVKDAKAGLKGKSKRESVAILDLDGDGKVSEAEIKAHARKEAKKKKKRAKTPVVEELDLDALLGGDEGGGTAAAAYGLGHVETKERTDYHHDQIGTSAATLARREAAIALAEQNHDELRATSSTKKVTLEEKQAARLQAKREKEQKEKEKKAAEAAERKAKADLRKQREQEMRDQKAAEMEEFRKAEVARRAAEDAEMDAVAARKKRDKDLWAQKVAEVDAMDIGVWEKKTKLKELKEVDELRKAEEAKQEAEEAEVRRKEKKAGFLSRFTPEAADPNAITLGDATLARNKAKRGVSKWNAPKPMAAIGEGAAAHKEPERRQEYDPQKQYLVTSKHLATMRRAVGSKRAIFDAINEELEEEHSSRQGEYDVACIYVETLVWSFHNRKSGGQFLEMMHEIVDDDRQAEAYFQVYELPVDIEGASIDKTMRQYDNDYLVGGESSIRYLTVAVGTTEQYCDLHRIYDMRQILNADVTPWGESADAMRAATQLKHQRGIKHVAGTFHCIKKNDSVGRVIADWNKAENIDIKFQVNRQVSVPGGWSTVSRYIGGTGGDLLMSFGLYQSDGRAASDSAMNWLEVARSEYKKVAPNMAEFIIFKGIKTPLDFETRESDNEFSSFSMHSCPLWLKAKKKSKVSVDDEMASVTRCKRWFFGPGASNPDLKAYVAGTRSNSKIAASILTPLL